MQSSTDHLSFTHSEKKKTRVPVDSWGESVEVKTKKQQVETFKHFTINTINRIPINRSIHMNKEKYFNSVWNFILVKDGDIKSILNQEQNKVWLARIHAVKWWETDSSLVRHKMRKEAAAA